MKGFLLFDIDGVIRDVSNSYRLAIQETVYHFDSWRPSLADIDKLKEEGLWNNDWEASRELIKRNQKNTTTQRTLPTLESITKVFNHFYFGGDPNDCHENWSGYINNEPILVSKQFFQDLSKEEIKWGFVSGAERPSAKFILETRLGLENPPLIAMGDAPEKPNPSGFLQLANELAKGDLASRNLPIAYLGDTVADIKTVLRAKAKQPNQNFLSFGIAPPHLRKEDKKANREKYEENLINAGADIIINSMNDIFYHIEKW